MDKALKKQILALPSRVDTSFRAGIRGFCRPNEDDLELGMVLAWLLGQKAIVVVVQVGSLDAVGKPRKQPRRLTESLSTKVADSRVVPVMWQLTCY